jgi:hypothetical protein
LVVEKDVRTRTGGDPGDVLVEGLVLPLLRKLYRQKDDGVLIDRLWYWVLWYRSQELFRRATDDDSRRRAKIRAGRAGRRGLEDTSHKVSFLNV